MSRIFFGYKYIQIHISLKFTKHQKFGYADERVISFSKADDEL